MRDRYAVIGNPVAHSKSPRIHAEFARATAQDIEYGRIEAPLDGFARVGLVIANRTVPRARAPAERFPRTEACGYGALSGELFHVLINATRPVLERARGG